ncbi:MAG TPA: DUF6603 domain-containing protein, partial [Fimbriimonadaceae bacterium]|nr:DUF6603 domain-containing protein [Fimbriimonadaceae bacterium]
QTAQTITFSGTGSGEPFAGMQVSVLITQPSGAFQLTITGQTPTDWTLATGFSEVKEPILQDLPLESGTLVWASAADTTANLVQGFNFNGPLDFSVPPLSFLKLLFSSISGATLQGDIQMHGSTVGDLVQYVPDASLNLNASQDSATFGPFTLSDLDLTVFLNSYFNTSSLNWATESSVTIDARLSFKSAYILLSADIKDIHNDVEFTATMDAPISAAISDLAGLLGTELSIPGFQLKVPDSVSLQEISVNFDPDGDPVVTGVSVVIGTDPSESWNLWGTVDLQTIKIVFRLIPNGSSGYTLDGIISGELVDTSQGAGGSGITVSAEFASDGHYTFYGGLNQPTSVKELYHFFTGVELDDLPDLDVENLDFSVDRTTTSTTYQGELEVSGNWTIVDKPVEIDLNRMLFTVTATSTGGSTNVDFEAASSLTVSDYSVGIDAKYASGKGWVFSGTAQVDEQVGLSDVAAKVDTTFSPGGTGNKTPAFITDWHVESLSASFATQSKDFEFSISITDGAVPDLTVGFEVNLQHGDTQYTKTLTATAELANENFDVTFQLVLSQTTGPPTISTITGTYTAAKPPHLSDLLAWISSATSLDVQIPAELGIDAEADDFAVQIVQQDQGPLTVEVAGEFSLQVEGSDWNVYFAYTNDATLQDGTRAMVGANPAYVFGAALGGTLDLSKLPLVGKIPGADKLRIDKLGFYYTNATLATGQTLNFAVPAIGDPGHLAPSGTGATLNQSGFNLLAVFGNQNDAGSVASSGTMPIPVNTGTGSGFATQQAAPQDPIHWLTLGKTFGPFALDKVGLGYAKPSDPSTQLGSIGIYVDGAFKIAGLAMALDALGVSFDVPKPGAASFNPMKDIDFHLGGLFVQYQAPDLIISGGFVTIPGGGVNFIGEFTVQAGTFGLQAYGGFSQNQGDPSMFLFIHVEAPIGGPPFFFVTGLAGGFGVNRAFKLPTFDQLVGYPFLPASTVIPPASQITGSPQDQLATMTQALTNLAQYVPVQNGEYWLAVGLDVTSFEMIMVSAVLSVAFGVEFQIGLVGTASMTMPVAEPEPIAYVQIDFEVAITPSAGLVAAFGKITPASFIYAGLVHISGGFAFSAWFAGPDAGNFVLTIGGYNPAYSKPSIYPDVPRIQITYGINSLNVTGDAYFALVPHALMAGLAIHATWSLGPIDAWFDAGMDFLLEWKPFHYEIDASVQIGISLTIKILFVHIRITIHVGVDLAIWGPPFGGQAVIDLDIVSITISFGQTQVRESVDWNGFSQFLPSVDADTSKPMARRLEGVSANADNKPLVNVTVSQGLVKAFKPGEDPSGLDWLIDPNGFALTTQSAAPCTDASYNKASLRALPAADFVDPNDLPDSVKAAIDDGEQAPFFAYAIPQGGQPWTTVSVGIPPMKLTNLTSTHKVVLESIDGKGKPREEIKDVIVELQTASFSAGLWGNSGGGSASLNAS